MQCKLLHGSCDLNSLLVSSMLVLDSLQLGFVE